MRFEKKMIGLNPNPKILKNDWLFDSREKKLLKIKRYENNNKILSKLLTRNNLEIEKIKKQIEISDNRKYNKNFIL